MAELEGGVGQNFRSAEREQLGWLPVSVRDWLPDDDLVWMVIDTVEQLDLTALRIRYRADGRGAAAYDPATMVALLLYAYATGERSSRAIERRCRREIPYRAITGDGIPDHATIARFRALHEAALSGLFDQVLRLCAAAGMGRLGLVALDGTRIAADASMRHDRDAASLDAEIARMLAEAAATDAAEDAAEDAGRGPDDPAGRLPRRLADRASRLARLQEARRQLAEAEEARRAAVASRIAEREARREAGLRLDGRGPDPDAVRRRAWTERNTTDPDARRMRGTHGSWLTGYNAQAVVAKDGIVIAPEVTPEASDATQLTPMLEATRAAVARAGLRGFVGTLLADAGYRSEANLALEGPGTPRLLIARSPRRGRSVAPRRGVPPLGRRMDRRLASREGRAAHSRRKCIVEPVFGHIKEVLRFRRFSRRGLSACAGEWRLVCTAHNLLKLWRHAPRPLPWRTMAV